MYLTKGDYKELYYSIIDNYSLDRYKEYEPIRKSLYYMFKNFDLFSNKYDMDASCKYMEKVIRFLTMYNIPDDIINENLVDVVGNRIANTDMFFYSIYSFVKPNEMVRISLQEYITAFYQLFLNNYRHWNKLYINEIIEDNFKNIKIDELKDILTYLSRSKIFNIYDANDLTLKYGILAIVIGDIYVNNKDYNNIDTYLEKPEYYINKLALNGYVSTEDFTYAFFNWDYIKNLFNNIDSFINDNRKKTIK